MFAILWYNMILKSVPNGNPVGFIIKIAKGYPFVGYAITNDPPLSAKRKEGAENVIGLWNYSVCITVYGWCLRCSRQKAGCVPALFIFLFFFLFLGVSMAFTLMAILGAVFILIRKNGTEISDEEHLH